jgi:hypothetical protein
MNHNTVAVQQGRIEEILLRQFSLHKKTGMCWELIMAYIEDEMPIKNWMVVRGVIQKLLNKKVIKRDLPLTYDHYRLVK